MVPVLSSNVVTQFSYVGAIPVFCQFNEIANVLPAVIPVVTLPPVNVSVHPAAIELEVIFVISHAVPEFCMFTLENCAKW